MIKIEKWNIGRKFVRRLFLEELSKSLTNAYNQRRAEEIRLAFKVKLAFQYLGYQWEAEAPVVPDDTDHLVTI